MEKSEMQEITREYAYRYNTDLRQWDVWTWQDEWACSIFNALPVKPTDSSNAIILLYEDTWAEPYARREDGTTR